MNPPVIVEGPDCCGKTTLSRHLAQKYGWIYWHCTASKALFPGLADYHENILDNIQESEQTFVLDRFWPSEVAYGSWLLRPRNNYTLRAAIIHEALARVGGLYVFCFSAKGWDRYRAGHEDPAHALSKDQYYQVYANYKNLFQELDYNKVLLYNLDTDGQDLDKACERIYEHLWKPAERCVG
jgi:thymidylate kinase